MRTRLENARKREYAAPASGFSRVENEAPAGCDSAGFSLQIERQVGIPSQLTGEPDLGRASGRKWAANRSEGDRGSGVAA